MGQQGAIVTDASSGLIRDGVIDAERTQCSVSHAGFDRAWQPQQRTSHFGQTGSQGLVTPPVRQLYQTQSHMRSK